MSVYVQHSGIFKRKDIGMQLTVQGMNTAAVEVGTHRGDYAREFLDRWPEGKLYCIDHWQPNYNMDDPAALGNREEDKAHALNILRKEIREGRVEILCMDASVAVHAFTDQSLDMVYVDANHDSHHVYKNLKEWWPKVKPGGLLAGHDYFCPGDVGGGWGPGVQHALNTFCDSEHIGTYYLIPEDHGVPWSFYVKKESN